MPKHAFNSEPVSAVEARRVVLRLAGLATVGARSSAKAVQSLVESLGYVQIDSINVLERAHHLILGARLTGYQPDHLKQTLESSRGLFEHWTHDASAIPTKWLAHWKHRFLRYDKKVERSAWWKEQFRGDAEPILRRTLARVRREGPLRARDFEPPHDHRGGGWWSWHPEKAALEHLWRSGKLAIARRERFEKVYDLAERVMPEAMAWRRSSASEHIDWACREAIDRLGIATPQEVSRFFSAIPLADAATWCRNAVKRGELVSVAVEACKARGGAGNTKSVQCVALPHWKEFAAPLPADRMIPLCPFDPVIRDRSRLLQLFGFAYRFEAFTPAAKRIHGYYTLPLLVGDSLVGRTDLKFDRKNGSLMVNGVWWNAGIKSKPALNKKLVVALDNLAVQIGATHCTGIGRAHRKTVRKRSHTSQT